MAEWLARATAALEHARVPSPRTDAQRLAAHALGVRWSDLWTRLREPLAKHELEALDDLLARRASQVPLAYVTGTAGFYGLELEVGPGVLVPRPETETLVTVGLRMLQGARDPVVIDVGTGSGAVALAIASERPDATVIATDTSVVAIGYARANAARLGLPVRFVCADLLAGVRPRADVVVSNPPYVPAGRTDLIGADVRREPEQALYAGPAGDEVLLRLVDVVPDRLRFGGSLSVEVGTPAQARTVEDAMGGWAAHGVEADSLGRPRVVWGVK